MWLGRHLRIGLWIRILILFSIIAIVMNVIVYKMHKVNFKIEKGIFNWTSVILMLLVLGSNKASFIYRNAKLVGIPLIIFALLNFLTPLILLPVFICFRHNANLNINYFDTFVNTVLFGIVGSIIGTMILKNEIKNNEK